MTLLFVDHRDSFTYNLVQYLRMLHLHVRVVDSLDLSIAEVLSSPPSAIVLGPGPGTPQDAKQTLALLETVGGQIPLLGVCLGLQCIAITYGAEVVRAQTPRHGKTSWIQHDGKGVFQRLSTPFEATRYHSLVVDPATLPDDLQVSATSEDGTIMGLRSLDGEIEGVQFHPESVVTAEGMNLLQNFVNRTQTTLQHLCSEEVGGQGG